MTDSKLNYLGPLPKALTFDRPRSGLMQRLPLPFLIVVGLPTLLAAIYFLIIASPRYVSEARFLVRAPNQSQPSGLGIALQGVGLPAAQTDAFAVHEYIRSRTAVTDLQRRFDLPTVFGPPGADIFSKYPRLGESRTTEGLHRGVQRFVTVGYDATTGISTLRVEAYRPRDAQAVANELLAGGERLVNQMNARAAVDAVRAAEQSREEAQAKLALAQQQLTAFRNRERIIDPARVAGEGLQMIGDLMTTVARLRAERAQLASEAPNSPQLPLIDARIAAFQNQIEIERANMAGAQGSLAPKISVYEDLVLNREFADKQLAAATAALTTAEQEARRQKLYLDRIVDPSLPDEAREPRRWMALLTVFATCLLIYGVGWLVWAGVREHRQD